MESPKSYAAKLLQSRQGTRQKLMVFIGLALVVAVITTAVLALRAEAMNYTRRVLECAYEPHVHTVEECGEPDARTCGLADYVVHLHNDDCYGEEGELVCPLPEEKPHTHDASCFVEHKELICGEDGITEEEAAALAASAEAAVSEGNEPDAEAAAPEASEPAHVHTGECYAPGERVLGCGQEEREAHEHTEECYASGGRVLGCGQEESEGHAHGDACYTPGEPVLTCGDAGEEHVHDEGCYTAGEPVLSCGQEERAGHAHTDECYIEEAPVLVCGREEQEAHAHTDECYTEGEPVLVCGMDDAVPAPAEDAPADVPQDAPQDVPADAPVDVSQHVHTEECYETVARLECGKLELHTHTDECYTVIEPENPEEEAVRVLTCTIPQLEEHVHGEACLATVELSPDEVAALKAQEMGVELRDLQAVYEDADVRVTVDYDTLSLVPEPAGAVLLNANTPAPEPTPNPLLSAEAVPEAAQPAAPEEENAPVDAEPADTAPVDAAPAEPDAGPAPEAAPASEAAVPAAVSGTNDAEPAGEAVPAAETEAESVPEAAPASEAAEPAAGGSEAPELVRVGLMAEGREWLPAATVTYTVQYLENGMPIGEPAQYVYTPGGALPVFPRSIARYYRECSTDAFIVTARYTALAQIPEEAELRASIISDEEQVAAYESAYKEALNTNQAHMLSLLDIGFWLEDAEVQPAAPVSITVQLLGEDGLPAGEPLAIVHFGEQTEVLAVTADDAGVAAFNMNGFSPVGIGQIPEADEEGRVCLSDKAFEWLDPQGLYQVTFRVNGIISPVGEEEGPAGEENADAGEAAPSGDAAAGGEEAEPEAGAAEPEENEIPLATDSLLDFTVNVAGESNGLYDAYAQAAQDSNAPLMHLSVLEYQIFYDGVEMDLSDCEITITVTPTMLLQAQAAEYAETSDVDNGDDDQDGLVEAADGESLLPAPAIGQAALLSLSIPQEDGEVPAADSAEEDPAESMILLDGADAVADAPLSTEMLAMAPAMEPAAASAEAFEPVMAYASTQSVSVAAAVSGSAGQAVVAVQGEANPTYTVQYYVWMDRPVETGGQLKLINTSNEGEGATLPINKGSASENPTITASNPTGNAFKTLMLVGGNVQYERKLLEAYSAGTYQYFKKPDVAYVDKLVINNNYEPSQIWVLTGTDQDDPDHWEKYPFDSSTYFTNLQLSLIDPEIRAGKNFIYIQEGTVIRFVYNITRKDEFTVGSNFYDYDISNGLIYRIKPPEDASGYNHLQSGDVFSGNSLTDKALNWCKDYSGWDKHIYTYTKEQGINSSGNYSGSGTKLAFGNVNTGTNLGKLTWSKDGVSNELNKYNNKGYQGCTFGLVTGLDGNGHIQYASGINAPKLFNEGDAAGKSSYSDYSLNFRRVGDTYTLTAVNGTSATGLDTFVNPANSTGIHTDIWTNNFWPMDSAPSFGTGTHDVKFGGTATFKGKTHELRFGPITQRGTDYTFPESDDGQYHNSYFGMHFTVNFTLTEDYIGPLDYWFFGDDDMWVFLDGKLVCDIGGVHSSVGEYVDLWDHIQKGSEGEHTLSFFYTERGASGSTCWMQFTLPSVSSGTPETSAGDFGSLQIDKQLVKQVNGETVTTDIDNGEEFQFTIDIKGPDNAEDYHAYRCAKYKTADLEAELKNGGKNLDAIAIDANLLVFSRASFILKADESIYIEYLPEGTTYTITEDEQVIVDGVVTDSKYNYSTTTQVNGGDVNDSTTASGTIEKGTKATVKFTNTYNVFNMPETGGISAEWYVMGGAALVLAAAAAMRKRRKKARA